MDAHMHLVDILERADWIVFLRVYFYCVALGHHHEPVCYYKICKKKSQKRAHLATLCCIRQEKSNLD